MREVPETPRDRAVAEAAEWMLRRHAGDVIEREPAFVDWIAQSELNRVAWQDAVQIWEDFDEGPDLLLAGMRQASLEARPARKIGKFTWWGVGSAVAAAAAILITAEPSLHGLVSSPNVDGKPLETLAFETPVGSRRDVTLPDGSRLTLDSGTVLRVSLFKDRRTFDLLRGQAYFAVAHDPARPFTVTSMGSSVTALGTEFDVLTKSAGMQVLLVKGSVAVLDGNRKLQLKPGEAYDSSPGAQHVDNPDPHMLLAWRDGFIEFAPQPLGQAIAQMNRYATHPIVVRDRSIAELPSVTGRFKAGDTEQFAQALASIYGLAVVHLPNGAIELRQSR